MAQLDSDAMDLVARLLKGDTRALARAITMVEGGGADAHQLLAEIQPHTGRSYAIGVTGPPGSGKSTMVDALIDEVRRLGKTVGVLAVDPNSPFTGGAVLGDRVRMQRHALDRGVFVRSMGARGHLGGLAGASRSASKVLDAFGCDYIVLETVGVGQSELEVSGICDTTIVVLNPSQGDDIQAIKAGILEIADIFALNKADLPGADRAATLLQQTYPDDMKEGDWLPPILKAVATRSEGIAEVLQAVEGHRAHVQESGLLDANRRRRFRDEVLDLVSERARRLAARRLASSEELGARLALAPLASLDPYEVADRLTQVDAATGS